MSDAVARESDGEVSVEIKLTNPATVPVTVDIYTTPGTAEGGGVDYRGFLRQVEFEVGVLRQIELITLIEDGLDESEENFRVRLIRPNGATIGDEIAVITISD